MCGNAGNFYACDPNQYSGSGATLSFTGFQNGDSYLVMPVLDVGIAGDMDGASLVSMPGPGSGPGIEPEITAIGNLLEANVVTPILNTVMGPPQCCVGGQAVRPGELMFQFAPIGAIPEAVGAAEPLPQLEIDASHYPDLAENILNAQQADDPWIESR
jgi:hypothetical protein